MNFGSLNKVAYRKVASVQKNSTGEVVTQFTKAETLRVKVEHEAENKDLEAGATRNQNKAVFTMRNLVQISVSDLIEYKGKDYQILSIVPIMNERFLEIAAKMKVV